MYDLSQISLFSGLTQQERDAVAAIMEPVALPAGTLVFEEGDLSDTLYLLVSGKVEVFISNANGEHFTLAVLEGGSYFGELAFLDHDARTASVRTHENSEFLTLDHDAFTKALADYPQIYAALVKQLVKMIRSQTHAIRELAMSDSYGNLRQLLNNQYSELSSFRKAPPKLSPSFIADEIETSQEIVVRLLDALAERRYLSVNNNVIHVHRMLPERL